MHRDSVIEESNRRVDVTLPLYLLGTSEVGFLGINGDGLLMWTSEAKICDFIGRTDAGDDRYTEVTDPISLAEILEGARDSGIREILNDPESLQQTEFSALWIDDVIDVMRHY